MTTTCTTSSILSKYNKSVHTHLSMKKVESENPFEQRFEDKMSSEWHELCFCGRKNALKMRFSIKLKLGHYLKFIKFIKVILENFGSQKYCWIILYREILCLNRNLINDFVWWKWQNMRFFEILEIPFSYLLTFLTFWPDEIQQRRLPRTLRSTPPRPPDTGN